METTVVLVTPESAADWLKNAKENRHIRASYVDYLAREIREGRFLTTHQGIAFDEQGRLIDGQHRLAAIVKAQMPVRIMVTTNLPLSTYEVFDSGKSRTMADRVNLPSKITEIYSVFLDLSNFGGMKKSPADVMALHKSYGVVVLGLLNTCNSHYSQFSSAPIRAAAVLSIISGQPSEYVLCLYRDLVLQNFSGMYPIGLALVKRIHLQPIALGRGKIKTGETSRREEMFVQGMFVFNKANSQKTRLAVKPATRQKYLDIVKSAVSKALTPEIPRLEKSTKKTEVLIKENLKLRAEISDLLSRRD